MRARERLGVFFETVNFPQFFRTLPHLASVQVRLFLATWPMKRSFGVRGDSFTSFSAHPGSITLPLLLLLCFISSLFFLIITPFPLKMKERKWLGIFYPKLSIFHGNLSYSPLSFKCPSSSILQREAMRWKDPNT
jgi:hypothetical protein